MSRLLLSSIIGPLMLAGMASGQGISANGTRRWKVPRERGPEGSSFNKAIVIYASDWESGVPQEYHYLATHYPGSKATNYTRQMYTHYTYDIITFTAADGKQRILYFSYRVRNR
jgi:hypothetical protein